MEDLLKSNLTRSTLEADQTEPQLGDLIGDALTGIIASIRTTLETQRDIVNDHARQGRQLRLQEVRLLSKTKAAKRLGIDRGPALDFLIKTKQLKTVTVGKRVKIPAADVERLAQQGFRGSR